MILRITVVVVDDHPIVRKGLVTFLQTYEDFEIIGEAENGEEAVELVRKLNPDILLMDLLMPVMNGVEATRIISKENKQLKILILTSYSDQEYVVPAIEAGANGYLLKDSDPEAIAESIINISRGVQVLDLKATSQLMDHVRKKRESSLVNSQNERLTNREKEVLQEIAKGKSNKEIADSLQITEKTVKTHVSNILSKLQLQDRTQAAIYALKQELHE